MSIRRRVWISFGVIVLLAALAGLVDFPSGPDLKLGKWSRELKVRLGLDLQGGTRLLYAADISKVSVERDQALEGVRDVIERRVNAFGVAEPIVQTNRQGDEWRVIVELAGIHDVNEAIRLIGETPILEFYEQGTAAAEPTEGGEAQAGFLPTGLSGKQLRRATVQFDPNTSEPQVSLEFDDEGKKLFADITTRNVGKPVAIILDGAPISIPTVQQPITDGNAVITGDFDLDAAKLLARRLNAGALPVPISLISQQTVGATLGRQSIERSIFAGIIGILAVMLFMIVYYRLPGLLAVFALGLYAALVLAIVKLFGMTLTLAGVTGFILSIGMAVDANILIFERSKEELRSGRDVQNAIEVGFKRAWLSIRDSNVSSIITCLILIWFGTSIVKGFAITLLIGILVSMFSAITVTRTLLRLLFTLARLGKRRIFGTRLPAAA